MVPKIWLKLPWEKRAYPVSLGLVRHGNDFVISLQGEGRSPIEFGGSPKAFVPTLSELLEKLESKSDYQPGPLVEPAPPVVVEEPEPEVSTEDAPEPEPPPPGNPDNRIRPTDAMMKDKPDDVKLGLMIDYFNAAPPGLYDWQLVKGLMKKYYAITGRAYKPRAASQDDETAQAVAKLLPYRAELLDENGQPKHGAKTQVASIMQFKQTGGGFARKIDAYLTALAEAA